MKDVPPLISALFISTALLCLFFLYRATQRSKPLLITVLIWLALQGVLGSTGFYADAPIAALRFALITMPPVVSIVLMLVIPAGKSFIDAANLEWCIWIHVVRIPVELGLWLLYTQGKVPGLMTFEGGNLDILSGAAAILVLWMVKTGSKSKYILWAWSITCMLLLLNILVRAVMSLPGNAAQFGIDTPNVAVLYFPYIWLPCFIVPAVIFSHIAILRKLLYKSDSLT